MIVSHRHRFVFVHIQRCGGSSVTKALLPHLGPDDVVYGVLPEFEAVSEENRRGGRLWKHSTAVEIRAALPDVWESYTTFTFVRDPWDRAVSLFHWWQQTTWRDEHGLVDRIRGMSFEQFLELDVWRRPCAEYAADEAGAVMVDRVGRYENLRRDFDEVCDRLGLGPVELPQTNGSVHPPYRQCYTAATAAVVAEAHRRDVEVFGYRLDQP